tara:strand:+ start:331 stop:951 length:621 start_codon:yes stop_codon:yes gene_type:complete
MFLGRRQKKKASQKFTCDVESDEEEVDNLDETIYSSGNKVYFYSDIDRMSILKLKRVIEELSVELSVVKQRFQVEQHIELHLYSNGGDVFIGLDMYNYIKRHSIPIHTYIDGMIASAATFIYLAGEKRFISDYNHVLIHQLSTSFWGKYEDLTDEFNNSKSLMNCIRDLYKKNTQIPKKTLDQLLKRELLLDTDKCIGFGVATDKI